VKYRDYVILALKLVNIKLEGAHMHKNLIALVIYFVLVSSFAANAESISNSLPINPQGVSQTSSQNSNVPYDFKGDELGISLDKFLTKHHDPGLWENKTELDGKGGVKSKRVWIPSITCIKHGNNLTRCSEGVKILNDVGVFALYLFVNNRLESIRLTLDYSIASYEALKDAMISKIGKPLTQTNEILRWSNNSSVAVLYQSACIFGFGDESAYIRGWGKEMSAAINATGCEGAEVNSVRKSNVIFVNKANPEISELVIKYLDEYAVETKNKARSNF
jgi:hypothetical protein